VARCEFDADAHLLTAKKARRLFAEAGFRLLRQEYTLLFPWRNRMTEWLERIFAVLPLGGQYCLLLER
jgi:hypothetical protein